MQTSNKSRYFGKTSELGENKQLRVGMQLPKVCQKNVTIGRHLGECLKFVDFSYLLQSLKFSALK